jgi:uncharacterized protein YuzE
VGQASEGAGVADDQDARGSGEAVDQGTDEAGGSNGEDPTVRRTVDELGDIVETTIDENGEILGEELVGNISSMPAEEEYVDEEGRVVSRVRDDSGNAFERLADDEGNMVGARVV